MYICSTIRIEYPVLLTTILCTIIKVERFKVHQSWEDALHARFDCYSGDPVTSDDEWGHLQVLYDIINNSINRTL